MKFMDEKGRFFGKLSFIDLLVVIAVIGLGLGYVYKQTSVEVQQIVNAGSVFYVTMECRQIRQFSVDAVGIGDTVFKRHDRQALGKVVGLETAPGTKYMLKTDGTALLAEVEDRFTYYITVECTGSITDSGYYVNGTMHVAEGGEIVLVSNRVFIPNTSVYRIGETKPEPGSLGG